VFIVQPREWRIFSSYHPILTDKCEIFAMVGCYEITHSLALLAELHHEVTGDLSKYFILEVDAGKLKKPDTLQGNF